MNLRGYALLATKFTNRGLYDWMLSQLSTTYFQAYQLAYDLAKRASKAYAFELDGVDPGYVQFGYWDSLHKGLCAGDKLMLDLRRLEAEYLKRNRRELEPAIRAIGFSDSGRSLVVATTQLLLWSR